MEIQQLIFLYLLTIPAFFAIDIIWIGLVANKFYQSKLGYLLGPVNWPAAIIFYLLYIIGILIFAVHPALLLGSISHAVLYGALFGFFAYATYDLTNLATVKNWPLIVTIIDLVWGTVLTASVAAASFYLGIIFIL